MRELVHKRSLCLDDEPMTSALVDTSPELGRQTRREIESQPAIWREALAAFGAPPVLARPGERVLLLGCGTSAFVAESIAALREGAGLGPTDAAYASEPRPHRDYDAVVALTRSGTTTEVLQALDAMPANVRRLAVTAVADSPVSARADEVLLLAEADETSVVQTRFPTTVLLLARAAFGEDVEALPDECERALREPLPIDVGDFDHFVYLGTGWTRGLAQEAALKIREAAQAWAESYPLLDYRHGPLAVAGHTSLVWIVGPGDEDLVADIRGTGARVVTSRHDPLVELTTLQRLAVEVAVRRHLDPDTPRHLTRSVILP
jgi:glucosamine--fructose-6-phosphate aminotransferase (isomerizing)